jgi:hypothetical protein
MSSIVAAPASISDSHRRPRAIAVTSLARVSARIGQISPELSGTMISRWRFGSAASSPDRVAFPMGGPSAVFPSPEAHSPTFCAIGSTSAKWSSRARSDHSDECVLGTAACLGRRVRAETDRSRQELCPEAQNGRYQFGDTVSLRTLFGCCHVGGQLSLRVRTPPKHLCTVPRHRVQMGAVSDKITERTRLRAARRSIYFESPQSTTPPHAPGSPPGCPGS